MAKVNVQEALDLRINHNLSFGEIAKMQGTCRAAIHARLKPLLPTKETEVFKANLPDILSEQQLKIILNMDKERLKSASLNNLAYSFKELYNCSRLERGLATANVDLHVLKSDLKGLEVQEQALMTEITGRGMLPDVSNNGDNCQDNATGSSGNK